MHYEIEICPMLCSSVMLRKIAQICEAKVLVIAVNIRDYTKSIVLYNIDMKAHKNIQAKNKAGIEPGTSFKLLSHLPDSAK